jgi:hypothetical protein
MEGKDNQMKPTRAIYPIPLLAALILAALAGCRGAAEPVVVGMDSATPKAHTATHVVTPTPELTETPLASETLIPSDTPLQTHLSTPTPTPLPTETRSFTDDLIIKQLCPEEREVKIGELGLSPNTHLLVVPYDYSFGSPSTNGLSTVSSKDPTPHLILNSTPPDGYLNIGYSISPDGRWFTFYRLEEGDEVKTLWISSVDGKQQWEIIQLSYGYLTAWVSDQVIIVMGVPGANELEWISGEDYVPLTRINPFTLEKHNLIPLSNEIVHNAHYDINGNPYDIYIDGWGPIYDIIIQIHTDNTTKSVFKWLIGKEWINISNFNFWDDENGMFTVWVDRPYGFDLAENLTIDSISQDISYGDVMETVKLPNGFPNTSVVAGLENSLYLIERYDRYSQDDNGINLFIFDFERNILIDYCFDREDFTTWVNISPDRKFVAYTFFEGEDGENPSHAKEVVILNLETGHISYLDGVKVVGWGIK